MPPLPSADGDLLNRIGRWRDTAARMADPGERERIAALVDDPRIGPVLHGIWAASSFLSDAMQARPTLLLDYVDNGPDVLIDDILDVGNVDPQQDRTRLMSRLRLMRRDAAVVIALADLEGLWPLERVTGELTRLADLATRTATDHLILEAARRGEIDGEGGPGESGILVLAMGKHGAGELNYSSDIDLIVLFDGQKIRYTGRETPMACAVKITRALEHILQHRTRDGFVFRTDFRLRPHLPGHPLALSVDDAEIYFERHGQNWERAAFIKARAVAGDIAAGEGFLKRTQPFIWRKHLDFAAIRDIHSIKRQINAYHGFGTVGVAGHDLKVGRGGIREIEFFAQTQQLILGGHNRELRSRQTLKTLKSLAAGKWIDGDAAEELESAYIVLRSLEHRVQMIADKQTQQLPAREQELARFARFAGFETVGDLERTVSRVLRTVEKHYAALFESETDLAAGRQLVFTGTENDPGTLETLRDMGFRDPEHVASTIRSWHHGHIRATRSTRARELLTELMPGMLAAMQRQADIDEAFRLFDTFVSSLPAGVQLFSLIRANPRLLVLLCDIMGAAPRLARHLSNDTSLFEAMLAPDFFEGLPSAEELRSEFEARLVDARNIEDVLDIGRRWAHGRQFQTGLHCLLGLTETERSNETHTVIAEVIVNTLLPRAIDWLAEQHGVIDGGSFVIIGMGKLGSRELTTGSDLDLVFAYDAPTDAVSDGQRPLPAQVYYARLGQRLVSALSARTAEGRLYEIDTRLRPSGNVGPVACSLANFRAYHAETAETWERQALTRARVIAGDRALAKAIDQVIGHALSRRGHRAELEHDVRRMRERIFKEHGNDDPWNLKHARGGLVEVEFIAQYLQLRILPNDPAARTTSIRGMIAEGVSHGVIDQAQGDLAIRAVRLHQTLQAVLRLSTAARLKPSEAPAGLREALVRAANRQLDLALPISHFSALEAFLTDTQNGVTGLFDILCPPTTAIEDTHAGGHRT
ncbi:MAG: bifunctional [glutamine synthetase] adenylyltransferase/[glutamine synthetase]-adenylyl-L-tyrosine phosphorylase [Geminicoccaceae bacterium]|nr:bifunctional [glutamine synthetase] adenylyltransferase/[glutamine synthetase]-adenylyl-L-tyrosine phosphorylase [Geminicoccaceae bacterium]